MGSFVAGDTTMVDVFISYARADLALAEPIKSQLEALDLKLFFDIEGGIDAGDAFPVRIGDAVTGAKAVLALWTPHALSREWCRKECHLAQQLGKLIPVAMAPVSASDLKEFAASSYESLTDFSGQAQHFGWSQTLASIARKLDAWAEANPHDPGAADTVARASRVRQAALSARPPTGSAKVSAGSTAAAAYVQVNADDPTDLLNFAETFPGTAEALEARRRASVVKQDHDRLMSVRRNQLTSQQLAEFLSLYPRHPDAGWLEKERADRLHREQEEARLGPIRAAEAEAKKAAEEKYRQALHRWDRATKVRPWWAFLLSFGIGLSLLVTVVLPEAPLTDEFGRATHARELFSVSGLSLIILLLISSAIACGSTYYVAAGRWWIGLIFPVLGAGLAALPFVGDFNGAESIQAMCLSVFGVPSVLGPLLGLGNPYPRNPSAGT